jgi:hypothetical protein
MFRRPGAQRDGNRSKPESGIDGGGPQQATRRTSLPHSQVDAHGAHNAERDLRPAVPLKGHVCQSPATTASRPRTW